MTTDIFQLLINSSGAAVVCGLFIWYLLKIDKTKCNREDKLQDILRELSIALQKNTDVLMNIEKRFFVTLKKKRMKTGN